jgi:hypothetical protein
MRTYSEVQTRLTRPKGRKVMGEYVRSVVRREFLSLYCGEGSGLEHLLDEEDKLLQVKWYNLRKWAFPLGLLGIKSKRNVVESLAKSIIEVAKDYPDVDDKARIRAVQAILNRGFPGLFTDPDPKPEG